MAKKDNNLLFKNELMWEEQQKKRKPFYKQWKTYAISLGIIALGTGTGLGIYYGVNANQASKPPAVTPGLTDGEIINQINNTSYETEIAVKSTVNDVKNIITAEFIKSKLTDEAKASFNSSLFTYKGIMIGDQDLNDANLRKVASLAAEIVYTYNSEIEQKTNVTITVTGIDDYQIADVINNVKTYTKKIEVKTNAKEIKIDAEFIKSQLTGNIAETFQEELFNMIKITIGDHELQDSDLRKATTIQTHLVYSYGDVKSATTDLAITITGVDDYQIADAINDQTFAQTVAVKSKANDIKIDGDVIKAKLTGEIETAFKKELFNVVEISVNGKPLSDNDLTRATTLQTKLVYSYGDVKSATTDLDIVVTGIDDQQIVDAINKETYTKTVAVNISASSIIITGGLIQEKLTGNIAEAFNSNLFNVVEISVNGKPLSDNDLTRATTLQTKLVYSYGDVKSATTNLDIVVDGIDDYQIVAAISQQSYSKSVQVASKPSEIIIDAEFIKAPLNADIKNAFKQELFHNPEIMVDGQPLNEEDLLTGKSINATIRFSYGNIETAETNLYIAVNNNRDDLLNVMNDFKFTDSRNIERFLDSKDQDVMKKEILTYLQQTGSWEESDLTLTEETSNSVRLTAKRTSKKFTGSTVLYWNLKLFEVWGINTDLQEADPSLVEPENKAELKGYFYLNSEQQIEYFDVYGYKMNRKSNEVTRYKWLHNFIFNNDNGEKTFTFEITDTTASLKQKFGAFDLTSKVIVYIDSSNNLYRNVKFFNPNTKQIEILTDKTTFEIDQSGSMTKLNER